MRRSESAKYRTAEENRGTLDGDRVAIPEADFPAGLPAWMHQNDGWAKRAGTAPILDQYTDRGEQINWWPDFVEHALGRVTDVKEFNLVRL